VIGCDCVRKERELWRGRSERYSHGWDSGSTRWDDIGLRNGNRSSNVSGDGSSNGSGNRSSDGDRNGSCCTSSLRDIHDASDQD